MSFRFRRELTKEQMREMPRETVEALARGFCVHSVHYKGCGPCEAHVEIMELRSALVDIAIPSLKYCEKKYGHDDQARLNLVAAVNDSTTGYMRGESRPLTDEDRVQQELHKGDILD